MADAPTRERIVRAAVRLFQARGLAAVGLTEILSAAEAPKGSMYHHFPGGKSQLALAAIDWLSGEIEGALDRGYAEGLSGAALIARLGAGMAGWLQRSGYREGCLIGAITLEAEEPALAQAARDAFRRWRGLLQRALERDGFAPDAALALADLAIAAAEGGLMLARAEQDAAPMLRAIGQVEALARRPRRE